MEDLNKRKRLRNQQVIMFTILMGIALISVWGLYSTARPFIEDLGKLNRYLIFAAIAIIFNYVWAVITSIPPKPPKKERITNPTQAPKPENPLSAPTAGIKSGIPPSPRKTTDK
jgi:hypothetical protein